ncbi:hypothetical protein CCP3SC1AL1_120006 [Gammaproteobacteria bacterium]
MSSKNVVIDLKKLYTEDFSKWAMLNSEILRCRDFEALDIEHILEELSDMGISERNELESRLTVLLAHLLKWQYQYPFLSERRREFKGNSWRSILIEQRNRIKKRFKQSPDLHSKIKEFF